MKTIIANGPRVANSIYRRLKPRVAKLTRKGKTPKLSVVLVGDNPASETYVKKKGEAAEKQGLKFELCRYPASISVQKLLKEIKRIQKNTSGLIIQLPLPAHLNKHKKTILNTLDDAKDIDCLTFCNQGRLLWRDPVLIPPTAAAMLEVLKYYKVKWEGKYVVMAGRGDLVGKPLQSLFAYYPITYTICSRWTKKIGEHARKADIILTATGVFNLIKGADIKKGAVVIDAGVCFKDGKMYGDIHFPSVSKKASLVTPTPGGIGPITVAKLIENTVLAAEGKI